MRIFLTASLVATTLLAGCGGSDTSSVQVENAWIRLPAVAGRPGAAYFTVATSRPEVLLEVTTPAAARTEMHESMAHGGMMSMRPLETAALREGETKFEPGGKHVMLYEIDPAMRAGDAVTLTLRFAEAPPATVEARTVSAGDPAPAN